MKREMFYVLGFLIDNCISLLCNVAWKRPTNHSSYYSDASVLDGASCNAVDGWESTDYFSGSCYHSVTVDLEPWVQIDLGDSYNIHYLNFSLREDHTNYVHYEKLSSIRIELSNTIQDDGELLSPSRCGYYQGPPTLNDIGHQIQVDCPQTGRYVRVTKESQNLQFCEVRVYADVPYVSCPLPSESWTCRELCYNALTNSEICPGETTTSAKLTSTVMDESLPSTISAKLTSTVMDDSLPSTISAKLTSTVMDDFQSTSISNNCDCNCPKQYTTSELNDYIAKLVENIKIDKKETATAKSKRLSARDNRPSAQAMGTVGILIIVLTVLLFVAMDIDTICRRRRQTFSLKKTKYDK